MTARRLRTLTVVLLVASLFPGGCTRTVERKIARVTPTKPPGPTTRPAPETAVYKIKVRRRSDDDYRSIRDTATLVSRGQTLGFVVSDDGEVLAVAGNKTFPVELPRDWRRIAWQTSYEQRTRFALQMDDALRTTRDVAVGAGVIAAFGWGFAQGLKDEDDDPMIERLREVERVKERRQRD